MEQASCKCDKQDEYSFCKTCCPEEFECLKLPHIEAYIKERLSSQVGEIIGELKFISHYDHFGNRLVELDEATYVLNQFKECDS